MLQSTDLGNLLKITQPQLLPTHLDLNVAHLKDLNPSPSELDAVFHSRLKSLAIIERKFHDPIEGDNEASHDWIIDRVLRLTNLESLKVDAWRALSISQWHRIVHRSPLSRSLRVLHVHAPAIDLKSLKALSRGLKSHLKNGTHSVLEEVKLEAFEDFCKETHGKRPFAPFLMAMESYLEDLDPLKTCKLKKIGIRSMWDGEQAEKDTYCALRLIKAGNHGVDLPFLRLNFATKSTIAHMIFAETERRGKVCLLWWYTRWLYSPFLLTWDMAESKERFVQTLLKEHLADKDAIF